MRNRLTFPSAGTETKYVWDKYGLNNNGIYKWDKHDIVNQTKYYWDKYSVNKEIQYVWNKYIVNESTVFSMNRYNIIQSSDVYAIYQRKTIQATKYLNLNATVSKGTRAEYAHPKGTYIYFITVDGKNVRFTQADVIANPMLCNPYLYGYCGVTTNSSYKHANYYFTDQTAMKISSDGTQIIFTNTYNYYVVSNTQAYPRGLTDSAESSIYIEVTLKWPNMEKIDRIDNYPKTGAKPKTSSYSSSSAFYDFVNDGVWKNDEPVYKIDYNNPTIITTTITSEIQEGLDETLTYYYEYTGQEKLQEKGDFIEKVTSTDDTLYPNDGIQDGYWYEREVKKTYIWDKYSTITGYTWDVFETVQNEYFTVKSYSQQLYNIASSRDWGNPEDTYYNNTTQWQVHWWNQPITNKITIYGINQGIVDYAPADEIEITLEELLQMQKNNTQAGLSVLDDWTEYYTIIGCAYDGKTYIWQDGYRRFYITLNDDDPTQCDFTITGDPYRLWMYNIEKGLSYNDGETVLLNPSSNNLPSSSLLIIDSLMSIGQYQETKKFDPYIYEWADYADIRSDYYTYKKLWELNQPFITYNSSYTVNYETTIFYYKYVDGPHPDASKRVRTSNLINTITDTNKNKYPDYGFEGEYFYYQIGDGDVKNEFLYQVYSNTADAYNNSGLNPDGSWTEFNRVEDDELKYQWEKYTVRSAYAWKKHPIINGKIDYNTYEWVYKNTYDDSQSGQHDGYYYIYYGIKDIPDEYIGVIYDENKDAYPEDGTPDNDYWYKYKGLNSTTLIKKGELIGSVESTNPNAYPNDNYQGQNWYVYTGSKLFQYLGDYLTQIDAEMMNAYPHNGIKGEYWYIYKGYENNGPYKSKWIQQVETNEQNAYPQDGINGYYWYVYNKSYEGYKLQIEDSQIRGGIDYKHNVNPEEDYTIGCVASAEIEFDYDNRNGDVEQYLNEEYCDYYTWQPNDNDWRLVGRFYLDNVNHNRKLVNIKAFDAIGAKCEKFVDEFIANYTFPTTLRDFFGALCAELGVTGSIDTGLVNAGFSFGDNFEAINITGRQLLQYIAEMSCGFIKAKPDDTIILTTYKTKELDLTNSQYTNTSIANYSVDKVEGLTVRTTDDDYGVSAGSKEGNRYIIENNPLFYAQSDDEIQAPVNNIYNKLKGITYTPADIELLQDFGIECGDIITLNGKAFYVMEKELSASGCKLKCFGNKVRAKQESGINSDIVALRGKTNELYRDLEKTQSTLTDRANGLQSQITQTAEEISLRVTNEVAGLESKIIQTADSITSTVTDQINQTKSEIKQTTDSISLQVDSQGELMAQLRLDVDGIALRGYVTFTDLAGSGTTVINGSNITTGTISADRINMTGAISWGDLDADCKDTIASYAGRDGDDADVPDYIHNTYIDATRIVSPTIQGGTLSAGTTADGYMKLSSTGLNFHSSEKPICGIGYYSGNKELPYIVLGAGVDDYGTDKGMIKKYTNGIWIGDGDGLEGNSPTGTGIFINFNTGAIQKYVNGSASTL